MLIYNKLTEIFADFRHFCRAVILLIFNYLHYQNSINTARWRHAGGGGLEIIVNKNLRNGGGTRRRPRCKYQAVHIQLLFVPLRRFSRWETASPPPSTVPQGGVSIYHIPHVNRPDLRQIKPFQAGFDRLNTLYNNYAKCRNSRYLGLFGRIKKRRCKPSRMLVNQSNSYCRYSNPYFL